MAETAAETLVPRPEVGRVFTGERLVRFGDVNPAGRARLDALSTYVQDLAGDDTAALGVATDLVWVVRRTRFDASVSPGHGERLELATWCSGLGRRWAERRVSIVGDRGARVEAALLWVALDRVTNRPVPLPADFVERAAPSAQGRTVSARLHHASAPPADRAAGAVVRRPWALRTTDFDLLGHVNNAASWDLVEQDLGAVDRRRALRAEMEYRLPVEPGATVDLVTAVGPGPGAVTDVWAVGRPLGAPADAPEVTFTTARVTPLVD